MSFDVDERGVTKHTLFRTQALTWNEIADYRLTIKPRADQTSGGKLIDMIEDRDSPEPSVRLDHVYLSLRLCSASRHLAVAGWFIHVAQVVNEILARIHPRLSADAADTLARDGVARFGPLAISERGIRWRDRPAVPREVVDCLEVFDTSPMTLRVRKLDKTFAYVRASLIGSRTSAACSTSRPASVTA